MRPVAGWLERFRRPAGVPAGAGDELAAELRPVFAALDEVEEEARALRAEAEREVERRLEAGAAEAERLLARWRGRAEAERARAEAEEREAAAHRTLAIERAAQEEAERIRARGGERIPVLVRRILVCITEEPA